MCVDRLRNVSRDHRRRQTGMIGAACLRLEQQAQNGTAAAQASGIIKPAQKHKQRPIAVVRRFDGNGDGRMTIAGRWTGVGSESWDGILRRNPEDETGCVQPAMEYM